MNLFSIFQEEPQFTMSDSKLWISFLITLVQVIWMSIMSLDSPLFLACFFQRLQVRRVKSNNQQTKNSIQVVLSPGSRWIFPSRVKRGIPIFMALLYPFLPIFLHVCLPFFLETLWTSKWPLDSDDNAAIRLNSAILWGMGIEKSEFHSFWSMDR